MKTVICTLFEGRYHYGVAALTNSLYANDYRGTIYVGYRGELPYWVTKQAKKVSVEMWEEAFQLNPVEDLELIFLSLSTNYSLTNYKPDFMLELIKGPANNIDSIYYFDPDIVVLESWNLYENWVNCGVALSEDVNSPMPEHHPKRVGWRNYYKNNNIDLTFKSNIYVNGGFIGVSKKDFSFLSSWKDCQEIMGKAIGGLENSIFTNQDYNSKINLSNAPKSAIPEIKGFQMFDKSDQDALNITVEVYKGDLSIIGGEVMGFKDGHKLMVHALGVPKPWNMNFLSSALYGKPPRFADDCYWGSKQFPVVVHSKNKIKVKNVSKIVAKLIGRFYRAS